MILKQRIIAELAEIAGRNRGIIPASEAYRVVGRHLVVSEEWKPIETAPKDGTFFLGYTPNGIKLRGTDCPWQYDPYGNYNNMKPKVFIYRFNKGKWELPITETDGCASGGYSTDCLESFPTHWMPLPPPPTQSARDDE